MESLKKRDAIDIYFNLYPSSKFYEQKRVAAEWRYKALTGELARKERYQEICRKYLNY